MWPSPRKNFLSCISLLLIQYPVTQIQIWEQENLGCNLRVNYVYTQQVHFLCTCTLEHVLFSKYTVPPTTASCARNPKYLKHAPSRSHNGPGPVVCLSGFHIGQGSRDQLAQDTTAMPHFEQHRSLAGKTFKPPRPGVYCSLAETTTTATMQT